MWDSMVNMLRGLADRVPFGPGSGIRNWLDNLGNPFNDGATTPVPPVEVAPPTAQSADNVPMSHYGTAGMISMLHAPVTQTSNTQIQDNRRSIIAATAPARDTRWAMESRVIR